MKTVSIVFFLIILFCAVPAFTQEISLPPYDRSVVYFVRTSVIAQTFPCSYFDSTDFIGEFNGREYVRYECRPGFHLFWAEADNRDFVEADLEGGKIYFIETVPIGSWTTDFRLVPIDPEDEKKMNKVLRLLTQKEPKSFTAQALEEETQRSKEGISKGLEKYRKKKSKGLTISYLGKDMNYSVE
jgi:hypothetical protein